MKKTFYISEEAWEILKTKKNKSRFICDLIIASTHENAPRIDFDIGMLINLLQNNAIQHNENKCKIDHSEEMAASISDLLNL